jgi:outer membrane protein OmpA-like peptidoglycan-associated protein
MWRLHAINVRSMAVVLWMLLLGGCAGQVFAPKGGMLFYPPEFPAADRAVKAAEASGKAAQCPDAFREAARLRDEAYTVYWSCRLAESLDLARKAEAQANALCPVAKAPAPPPAPAPAPPPAPVVPPPPPPAPTASIAADPASVQQGQCTTLRWSSQNASSASIDPGLGSVSPSGSQQVCPSTSTEYRIAATGAGGSATASTRVAVTAPPPPAPAPAPAPLAPPAPKVVDRLTLHVNFDTDKAVIRPADVPELQKAIDFLKKYPGHKVSIEGHTDSRGSDAYNQRLSERRAGAVKDYLAKRGAADPSRMSTVGHGESRPTADNATAKGRFENRRVEVLILSE